MDYKMAIGLREWNESEKNESEKLNVLHFTFSLSNPFPLIGRQLHLTRELDWWNLLVVKEATA